MIDPTEHMTAIRSSARRVAANYGGRHDPDDIAQAIVEDILTHPERYQVGGRILQAAFTKAAHRYTAKENASFMTLSSEYIYSSEELKRFLPRYFSGDVWPNGASQPHPADYDAPEEFAEALESWHLGTELSVEALDVEWALERITPAQRKIIEKKYRDGGKLDTKYERNLHTKAIRWVTFHVNNRVEERLLKPSEHEGPGGRPALSSAQAQYYSRNQDRTDTRPTATVQHQQVMRRLYPSSRASRHVKYSPFRKEVAQPIPAKRAATDDPP